MCPWTTFFYHFIYKNESKFLVISFILLPQDNSPFPVKSLRLLKVFTRCHSAQCTILSYLNDSLILVARILAHRAIDDA